VKGTKQLRIEIYNTKGQLICTLLNEMKTTGNYSVVWNGINDKGESVPSGIYFYKMTSGNSSSSKKMVLID
jgi:flagellar hook assembly protein FlgD